MRKKRNLRFWDGPAEGLLRLIGERWVPDHGGRAYVAALTMNDAMRMIHDALGFKPVALERTIKWYWNENFWDGDEAMAEVPRERGIWVRKDLMSEPVRVFPGRLGTSDLPIGTNECPRDKVALRFEMSWMVRVWREEEGEFGIKRYFYPAHCPQCKSDWKVNMAAPVEELEEELEEALESADN
jgi:hypothetical protein